MPPAQRAKQFSPFAALNGLEAALAKQERAAQPRAELSEEETQALDLRLRSLAPGDRVRLLLYAPDGYFTAEGTVAKLDEVGRRLLLTDRAVRFCDILRFL